MEDYGQGALNVLIVDDEPLIRRGLRMSVPWKELGYRVVSEAGTAAEAKEKLECCHVDLALVDVQMPGTNGIDFIREVRSSFPDIKFLIISGHSDFEYVVSALKLSVYDYLLKPINLDELSETLKKIRGAIEAEQQARRVRCGQQLMTGKMFVHRLISRDFKNREEIDAYCSRCGIAFPLEHYCVSVLGIRNFNEFLKEKFDAQGSAFEASLDAYLQTVLPEGEGFFTALIGNYYAVLAQAQDMPLLRDCLYRWGREEDVQVIVNTGEVYDDIFFADVSYLQAVEQTRRREHSLSEKKLNAEIRLSYLSDRMLQKLEERSFDEARQAAQSVFAENLFEESGVILNWCITSLNQILEYFQLAGYEEMYGLVYFDIQTFSHLYFITTIRAMYLEKFDKICALLESMTGAGTAAVVARARKMMQEEYGSSELSMQTVAETLGISYNYLSTIFNQVSGESFSSCLTKIRMGHAKRLIMDGNLKMYEVAERVGYVNARYFTEQFKKTVGMTPREYREQGRNSEEE